MHDGKVIPLDALQEQLDARRESLSQLSAKIASLTKERITLDAEIKALEHLSSMAIDAETRGDPFASAAGPKAAILSFVRRNSGATCAEIVDGLVDVVKTASKDKRRNLRCSVYNLKRSGDIVIRGGKFFAKPDGMLM